MLLFPWKFIATEHVFIRKHCFFDSSLKEHNKKDPKGQGNWKEVRVRDIKWNLLVDFSLFKLLFLSEGTMEKFNADKTWSFWTGPKSWWGYSN